MNWRLGLSTILGVCAVTGLVGCSFTSWKTQAGPSDETRAEGVLAACPDQPRCVSTQSPAPEHAIVPFTYSASVDDARAALKEEVLKLPRTNLVKEDGLYLQFEVRSQVLRVIDDVEFIFDEQTKTLQFRSASRFGYSDWGTNRKRMEELRNKILGRI